MSDQVTLDQRAGDGPQLDAAFVDALDQAVTDQVASRIGAQDATLWGPDAETEAAKRLSWVDLAQTSRPLVDEIGTLHDELASAGLDHVVLCGMGGSSLAPEVICATAGVELTVLDSSQPDMVRSALADRLDRTVVVVSSKSGGTVETDSQRRAYEQAFRDAGVDPAERIVVVTDPGSPLDGEASEAGYRVFHADPEVGGRYSALTAFGLVPSGLAGVDVGALLDDAAAAHDALVADTTENPALRLGVLMGVACRQGVDKLVLADRTGHGVGDWIEQLIAESTGKLGTGVLPVVVEDETAPGWSPATDDAVLVAVNATDAPDAPWSAAIDGPLAAQMLAWEVATAVAGRVIGINPFDQPDVESAKAAARELLDGSGSTPEPDSVDGDIALFGSATGSVTQAIADLLDEVDPENGYLAIQAYLDRIDLVDLAGVRPAVARRIGRPVTFGWGPRFLHSTGQYHKGGTPNGVFLQITADQVLRDHGRPVLTLHLGSLAELARVRDALG